MVLAGIVGAVMILFIAFSGGESASSVSARFMGALAKGDYKTLAKLSYIPDRSQQELEEKWKFTTEVGKHYLFLYRLGATLEQGPRTATTNLSVTRNAMTGGSFEENFPIPLTRQEGKWKVEVRGLSRKLYPSLPR